MRFAKREKLKVKSAVPGEPTSVASGRKGDARVDAAGGGAGGLSQRRRSGASGRGLVDPWLRFSKSINSAPPRLDPTVSSQRNGPRGAAANAGQVQRELSCAGKGVRAQESHGTQMPEHSPPRPGPARAGVAPYSAESRRGAHESTAMGLKDGEDTEDGRSPWAVPGDEQGG